MLIRIVGARAYYLTQLKNRSRKPARTQGRDRQPHAGEESQFHSPHWRVWLWGSILSLAPWFAMRLPREGPYFE
jgi:hypothetical protein